VGFGCIGSGRAARRNGGRASAINVTSISTAAAAGISLGAPVLIFVHMYNCGCVCVCVLRGGVSMHEGIWHKCMAVYARKRICKCKCQILVSGTHTILSSDKSCAISSDLCFFQKYYCYYYALCLSLLLLLSLSISLPLSLSRARALSHSHSLSLSRARVRVLSFSHLLALPRAHALSTTCRHCIRLLMLWCYFSLFVCSCSFEGAPAAFRVVSHSLSSSLALFLSRTLAGTLSRSLLLHESSGCVFLCACLCGGENRTII